MVFISFDFFDEFGEGVVLEFRKEVCCGEGCFGRRFVWLRDMGNDKVRE